MKRPIGLILSAIVLSLAALFLLLFAAFMTLGAVLDRQTPNGPMPPFILYVILAMCVIYLALAAWAIVTVVGILRLRSWARYSILIIGGGLAAIGVFGVIGILISKSTFANIAVMQANPNSHIMSVVAVMTACYLLIAATGIWWLVYFNLRSTREFFLQSNLPPLPSQLGPQVVPFQLARPITPISPMDRVPTAIKIIAIFLLIGSVCCVHCACLPFPAFFLGFILPPPASRILYLAIAVLTAVAGYGLFRLKEFARLLTTGFLALGSINVLMAILPWYQAQLHSYTQQVLHSIPTMPGQPQPSVPFNPTMMMIFTSVLALAFYAIVFWILHRERTAFQTPNPPTPPPAFES